MIKNASIAIPRPAHVLVLRTVLYVYPVMVLVRVDKLEAYSLLRTVHIN